MFVWWVVTVAVTGILGLLAKWMVLRFLHRIYERGGREDMVAAAEALRYVRAWHVTKDLTARRVRRAADPARRRGEPRS